MKNIWFPSLSILLIYLIVQLSGPAPWQQTEEILVAEALEHLEAKKSDHRPQMSVSGVSVEAGRRLVQEGIGASKKGRETDRQSKHFVCTSCHNIQREDPDLTVVDPQARLEYVRDKGLPFLQGSALYGVVNRSSFYNGDYEKKYGDLVRPARHDIRNAIQLCATECAQGRPLTEWEMESVVAYLWTIGLKISDLDLSEKERQRISEALQQKRPDAELAQLIRDHYLQASPATFVLPPEDRQAGYEAIGDPENGKWIYDLSCMHCHARKRYSFFELDNSEMTFEFLEKHFPRYTRYSIYQVARYGTSPMSGKRAYMPHYPLEKMSNQQLEDLRAYIGKHAAN